MARKIIKGLGADLKRFMLKDPSITVEALSKKLTKAGHEPKLSSVQTLRSDFLHSLKVMKEQGKLTPDLAERISLPVAK